MFVIKNTVTGRIHREPNKKPWASTEYRSQSARPTPERSRAVRVVAYRRAPAGTRARGGAGASPAKS